MIPFAKQARNAFISKKILISLVDKKILSKSSYFKILSKLKTVSHDHITDQKNLDKNKITIKNFNKKYFHLRPNSYDILNRRNIEKISCNELEDRDINKLLNYNFQNVNDIITFKEFKKIRYLLKKNKINIDVNNLLIFCISSLKLRENYKFMFTRTLSDGIQLLRYFSKKSRLGSMFSNIDINSIFKMKKQINIPKFKKAA